MGRACANCYTLFGVISVGLREKDQVFGDCLEMVGREELQPCISIDRSAELTGFLLHYVKSSLAEDPSPCLGANAISLFTCL